MKENIGKILFLMLLPVYMSGQEEKKEENQGSLSDTIYQEDKGKTDDQGDVTELQDVVVIGYGSAKKADLTGSIVEVKSEIITKQPNANVLSSLQGRVSGVQIINSGEVGTSPAVRIRGVGSTSDKVLYVVDGVLTNDITFLNPNDVETMTILKDASSAAIYGIQAANGVIIIKTKTGKAGENVKVSYDGFVGIQKVQNVPVMSNTAQFLELINEKIGIETGTNGTYKPSDFKGDTDWFKEVINDNAMTQSHNLSFSGGSEKATYSLGIGYFGQEGTVAKGTNSRNINTGDDYERITARFNTIFQVTEKLKVGFNTIFYDYNKNNSINPFGSAYMASPTIPVYDATGNYGAMESGYILSRDSDKNPRAEVDYKRGKTAGNRILIGGFGEYEIINNLSFKMSYNKDISEFKTYDYQPEYHYGIDNGDGTWSKENTTTWLSNTLNRQNNWIWDNTLSYKFNILEKHNFTILGGLSMQEYFEDQLFVTGYGVEFNGNDSELYLDLAKDKIEVDKESTLGVRNRFMSQYGRLMYNFNEKYLFNATVRRDGASNFNFNGDQKYEIFPSVGFGWIVSKEDFFKTDVVNFFKMKGSWGKLGNANVPRSFDAVVEDPYSYDFGGNLQSGRSITDIVDSTINWEIVTELDFGFESRFFNDRLSFEMGYYDKKTSDAIATINLLTTAGDNEMTTNAADFANKGFEFDIKWNDNITDKINYSVYGNITTISNEITAVKDNSFQNIAGVFAHSLIRVEKGAEVGSYWGYKIDGVYQTDAEAAERGLKAGAFKFTDLNNDGKITEEDKTTLGSPIPEISYGFGALFNIYDFDFSFDFSGVTGNEILNINRLQRYGAENYTKDFYDNRWHGEGTSTTYPSAANDQNNQLAPSEFYVEKGDYLRLRSVQLGYTIPSSLFKNKISRFRLYGNIQNALTISNYKGITPEVNNTANGVWETGIDRGIRPIFATVNFGININF